MRNNSKNNKNMVRRAFSERFNLALKEAGYSANQFKELQKLFLVSGQAIRKWVSGQTLPTSARMPQIAELLGVRRAWLQDGEQPMRPLMGGVAESDGSYSVEQGISSEEMNLILKFRALDLKQRKVIQQTVAIFLSSNKSQPT